MGRLVLLLAILAFAAAPHGAAAQSPPALLLNAVTSPSSAMTLAPRAAEPAVSRSILLLSPDAPTGFERRAVYSEASTPGWASNSAGVRAQSHRQVLHDQTGPNGESVEPGIIMGTILFETLYAGLNCTSFLNGGGYIIGGVQALLGAVALHNADHPLTRHVGILVTGLALIALGTYDAVLENQGASGNQIFLTNEVAIQAIFGFTLLGNRAGE